jgi:hypothetical protein
MYCSCQISYFWMQLMNIWHYERMSAFSWMTHHVRVRRVKYKIIKCIEMWHNNTKTASLDYWSHHDTSHLCVAMYVITISRPHTIISVKYYNCVVILAQVNWHSNCMCGAILSLDCYLCFGYLSLKRREIMEVGNYSCSVSLFVASFQPYFSFIDRI